MKKHPAITINDSAKKWGRDNVLFLSFCPHLFASSGQGGAAFEGGQDGADCTQLHLI
jgi:hypothetical protein